MELKGKEVLVTGAGGFIGSHLAERLVAEGANVHAFVRYNSKGKAGFIDSFPNKTKSKIDIMFGDVLELETIRKALKNIDCVFHLAASISVAYSFKNPEEVIAVNSKGTLNVLTAAKDSNVKRIITTSSSEVYGTALTVPINEDHPLQGQSPYAASKIAGDKYAESFYKSYKLPITVVRPFNTYGPRQSARAIIPTIIMQALTKDKIRLGSLTPRRDFTFVTDTADGFIKTAESDKDYGGVINLSNKDDISIGELAEKIIKIIGKKIDIECSEERVRPEKAEVQRLLGDNSKAKKIIGWSPKVSLDEGLKATIKWISENIGEYKPDEYSV
ncbi:MAG: SDR family NAD(P)-dependent oxidoreductase [Nanoarchaeota archaeon]|nr:SDR family NAD(P)-dependent oxidoreductase [Nanoarchaeota archaeon]MBU1005609.1 SDR family NAD(P)-dependent oxidoreductase [Nanoarchaeota archaeon]MBU1945995.1 SDR family NAD(P)-dependent oxidoreductase [Nanoarchaeota archaeon]